ncbi:OmpH/Skp family outer membrane protein [Pseudidiomarina andamanensis]|uniref:OmpH family outer membrane protein n=1 Tax=Pseudidiomarina andamanensis TaxID=1940690 RepID=UPI0015658212|nr:OmpH family outer membrane protein [Pseudidiomarina andamanensis]MDS0218185.1 OmpH family outer membrane protein [Pseudidiomarina andamanensis]
MKAIVKSSIAVALLSSAFFANAAEAQQKIGFVSMQEVLANLPQARNLEQQVQDEFKGQIEEVTKLEEQMRALSEKAQRDASIMSPAERIKMEREMEMLDTTRQLKVKALREDMGRRGNELRDKLMTDVMRNAQAVASEQSFDVVLQSSALVYAADSANLTDEVVKKMTGGN